MAKLPSLFLVGPMGAGKSTIGRRLAEQLKRDFYDSDKEIESRCGVDVAWIFDVEGEEGFRKREQEMIAELVDYPGIVLATGGGAIISAENRRLLSAKGIVIYLRASIEQQMQRIIADGKRPVLQYTKDLHTDLIAINERREVLYKEIADWEFTTDKRPVKAVVDEIVDKLLYSNK